MLLIWYVSEWRIRKRIMSTTIFICYARKDKILLNELKAHLRPFQRQGLIELWDDGDISAGTDWEQEISKHLNTAQIILLLVSPSFLNSDYCYGIEMRRAIEKHERKEAQVIPIILDHVHWQVDPLNKLQALPTDGKPVMSSSWFSLNEAFFNVTRGILLVIDQLRVQYSSNAQSTSKVFPLVTPLAIKKYILLHILKSHTHAVTNVVISADGQTLISASLDGTTKVWDLSTGYITSTFIDDNAGEAFSVDRSIAISADGQTLVHYARKFTVWNLSTGEEMPIQHALNHAFETSNIDGYVAGFNFLAISADGQTLVGVSWGMIKVWNLLTGKEVRNLHKKPRGTDSARINSIAISPDGQTLVGSDWNSTASVWDLSTGNEIRTFNAHGVAISADGQTLISAGNGEIKVWDLPTGNEIRTFKGDTSPMIAISADGQTLVGATRKEIKVWDLPTGEEVQILKSSHTKEIKSVAISPDGRTLVSGSVDCTIEVWRA
jgi:COMPASS component SWD3